ncbi:MAG TPA: ATP-binding protein [Pirellulales bacterium]|nr:ATP-binding protein [Pirellulales bacterium]
MIFKRFKLRLPVWLQLALVGLLFLGSLFTLAYGALTARPTTELESATRARLRQASGRMAAAAATLVEGTRAVSIRELESQGRTLSEITEQALKGIDGAEGGFYVNGKGDRFSGYAFPTGRPPPPRRPKRDEPPPLEEPYIRIQARQSLSLGAGEISVTVRDVFPSRVMILTEPVGTRRPAVAATWLMYRLVDPRLLNRQVQQYRASSGLALGGLLLAMVLLAGLARNLKRQQGEQARLQNELRRSERLASLGKLLAGVAHEVRNPLAAIRSTVQLWQRLPEQARTPESLDAVVRAVDRLNETVSQLLYFSRADATQREPVDVNGLLRETLELFAAQAAQQHVALRTDLSDDVGSLLVSPGAMAQVFANLSTNALQSMPAGGELLVATQRDGHRAVIEFADTGPGIAPEVRAHLFEPFFTTRPNGTGLGLALCREIIVQHEGTIECLESAHGARFRIELPA